MKFLSPATKFYVALFLEIGGLVLFIYFGSVFLIRRIDQATKVLETTRQDSVFADRRVFSAHQERAKLNNFKDTVSAASGFFFDSTNPLGVIEVLESIGRRAGVDVEINPLEAAKDQSTNFRLSAKGAYPQVSEFVRLLEQAPVYFEIQQYWLDRDAPEGLEGVSVRTAATPKLRATLTVRAFSIKSK